MFALGAVLGAAAPAAAHLVAKFRQSNSSVLRRSFATGQRWFSAVERAERPLACFFSVARLGTGAVMVGIVKRVRSTSFRTFVLYPLIIAAGEWLLDGRRLRLQPWYLPLLVWGYLQYRLTGRYRMRHGGGGPGMDTPPVRLVVTGPFAWCRNPMYLGHIVFLLGLALTLQSLFGALVTAATAVWFQLRVRRDEQRLQERFGQPYQEYSARVTRWIPRLF